MPLPSRSPLIPPPPAVPAAAATRRALLEGPSPCGAPGDQRGGGGSGRVGARRGRATHRRRGEGQGGPAAAIRVAAAGAGSRARGGRSRPVPVPVPGGGASAPAQLLRAGLAGMSPAGFKGQCAETLEKNPFGRVEMRGGSGGGKDRGNDLPVRGGCRTIAARCKHRPEGAAGRPVVQKLRSASLTARGLGEGHGERQARRRRKAPCPPRDGL